MVITLLVLVIEKKGFDVKFQNEKALIKPIRSSSDKAMVFSVRDNNLYRLKGQPL
jgi:hypothetical protein